MAFLPSAAYDLSPDVLQKAETLAAAYRGKRPGCTLILKNETKHVSFGGPSEVVGRKFFKPRLFGLTSFGESSASLHAVKPGHAEAWASQACDDFSGTNGFIKYPIIINAADGPEKHCAATSLYIFWNVPGPEAHNLLLRGLLHLIRGLRVTLAVLSLAVSTFFQCKSDPAWCAAVLPSSLPDETALDTLWRCRRSYIRRPTDPLDLVLLDTYKDFQLSGTMACPPGTFYKDYRIYINVTVVVSGAGSTSDAKPPPVAVPPWIPTCVRSCETIDIKGSGRFGVLVENTVYALQEPAGEPTMDIVFMHGLQRGAASNAWIDTWSCEIAKRWECWPKYFLTRPPPAGFDHLRILSVTYNADAIDAQGVDIHSTGQMLAGSLSAAGVGDRPVVFVAHSLGGLVMKQLIAEIHNRINAFDRITSSRYSRFFGNLKAMVFYGTPHLGAPLANRILVELLARGPMRKILRPFNSNLAAINNNFEQLRLNNQQWMLLAFAEQRPTRLGGRIMGWETWVVPESSALPPGWPLEGSHLVLGADHYEVCRATNAASLVLTQLVQLLRQLGAT